MSVITVKDKSFVPYLTAAQIDEQIKRLGAELNKDYAGKNPLFIAVLNGSFMFAATPPLSQGCSLRRASCCIDCGP